MLESALYITATPIGNLSDVSRRAIEVLQAATLIAAEDTRHSKIFLNSIGVSGTRMISCHDHNEAERADLIEEEIKKGGIVALISDAGTPLISDPGFRVVRELGGRGVKIIPIPGCCAAIAALCVGGLPTDEFLFKGFLPVKDKELKEAAEQLRAVSCTTVFYESPRRILNTVKVLGEIIPKRSLVLCRELTKAFESVYRLTTDTAYDFLIEDENRTKGEFVILVGPAPKKEDKEEIEPKVLKALEELIAATPAKLACKVLSDLTGVSKNALYSRALALKNKISS